MHTPYKDSFSNSISNYLIKSLEEGTNSCYKEKKEVDDFINNNYAGISVFAKELLLRINYNKIKPSETPQWDFSLYDFHFSQSKQARQK